VEAGVEKEEVKFTSGKRSTLNAPIFQTVFDAPGYNYSCLPRRNFVKEGQFVVKLR
jgi:hypothetical protein